MSDEKKSPAYLKNVRQKNTLRQTTTRVSSGQNRAKVQLGIQGRPKLKKTKKSARNRGLSDYAKQQQRKGDQKSSFTEALDQKSLDYFNEVCSRPFSEQAQFFLNAFWDEFGKAAEVIYAVHWDVCKKIDMDSKNIHYLHLYEEGIDLDFDCGLLLFEKLCKYFNQTPEGKQYAADYPQAVPVMMTSITRKKELRAKVDVNFDGRVGFLEFLLYQFEASPKTLMERSTRRSESNPELDAAREALAVVNRKIRAYEAEKARLTKIANKGRGVKSLGAKNMLAQMDSSPQMEELRAALILAEAKVRIVAKRLKIKLRNYKAGDGDEGGSGGGQPRTQGSVWWMKREIKEKKRLYGKSKRRVK